MTLTTEPTAAQPALYLDPLTRRPTQVAGVDHFADPEFLGVRDVLERELEPERLGWDRLNRLTLAVQETLARLRCAG